MKTLLLVTVLTLTVGAQTLKNTEAVGSSACYYPHTAEIWMNLTPSDSLTINKFLHELGHHLWAYGGFDTTAYKKHFNSDYEAREWFANIHVSYFWYGLKDGELADFFNSFYNKKNGGL